METETESDAEDARFCSAAGCNHATGGTSVASLCGGIMSELGCGWTFCDLVGRRGPFFCRPCWERRKDSG